MKEEKDNKMKEVVGIMDCANEGGWGGKEERQ